MIDENKYYSMIMDMLVFGIIAFVLGLFGGALIGTCWFDAYIANIVRPIVYPKSIDCEAHKNIHTQELIEALIKEVNHARQTNS